MVNEENLFKYIINQMSPTQLQDMFDVNKIKLDGFRKNGRNTKAKVLKMQNTLKKRKDLEPLISKCVDYYVDNQKIEYMWAMPNKLEEGYIEQKISSTSKSNVIIELFAAEKYEEITRIMEEDWNESNEAEEKNEKLDLENSNQNVESIEKIRSMLIRMEEKYRNLELRRNNELEEFQRQTKFFEELHKQNKQIKEELTKKNRTINEIESEKEALNNEIKDLKNEVKKKNRNILTKQKYKVAIVGNTSYEMHLAYKLQTISTVNHTYLNEKELKYIRYDQKFDAVWVMRFSLSRKENEEVRNTIFFQRHFNINRCTVFEKAEEFHRFTDKVRDFYE